MPRTARAADTVDVSPTGKGIVGGFLLGAEAITLTEAALGVKPPLAYILGGAAGGVAGGAAGYFLEKNASEKANTLVLAGGMLLIIPTTVAILSATAYEPPASYTQDRGPTDEPLAEPPAPDMAPGTQTRVKPKRAKTVARAISRPAAPPKLHVQLEPPSLLGLDQGHVCWNVPAVELREVYSAEDRAKYGATRETEVRVPVFALAF
jgi:hypothetical protein